MTALAIFSSGVLRIERAVDRLLSAFLGRQPGWGPVVLPYISYGTTRHAHVRARVLLSRRRTKRNRPALALLDGLAHFFSVEVPGEEVSIDVAGQVMLATAGPEGYVEATLDSLSSRQVGMR